ncbi:2-oxo-3-hexenedioate decarboxylase [Gemmobacter megaterium]|uniref:2-oxo-3-hexenedioate decarboxylase n=1 Tax=Gemmobacter megaterium TaxID=1086013 RepID=A0A1N7KSL9_9RHOB|nr:fumarylacetoacetate hydrolase family protein [Gemmobacter megaterium]GGE03620.1 2-hydroxypenta-2,4-dienoate hydratase [Gemmobacter megaterium]SIS64622.1 2-oxo-3-hexenedioate decarboxylase [Gemmobacter megaterium]
MTNNTIHDRATALLAAYDTVAPLAPLTDAEPDLSVPRAYAIAAEVMRRRAARGERVVGWKIGFTNRTIWDEYDVHAPIWGCMYDSGLIRADAAGKAEMHVSHLHEPRIEPEIAFRISRTPDAGMTEAALLGCIDAMAHGFEIVQSPFPGWRFRPVDTMAAGALHGGFVLGPWLALPAADHAQRLPELQHFTMALHSDHGIADQGTAANVLGGPLSALRHFVQGLADCPHGRGIAPGDIVTTGTVTRAFPVAPGQIWTSQIDGVPLRGLTLRCI